MSVNLKFDSEFLGSFFGLIGAGMVAFGMPSGFGSFLISNVFFLKMAGDKKMIPFFVLQVAFLLTSVIGIYRNFL